MLIEESLKSGAGDDDIRSPTAQSREPSPMTEQPARPRRSSEESDDSKPPDPDGTTAFDESGEQAPEATELSSTAPEGAASGASKPDTSYALGQLFDKGVSSKPPASSRIVQRLQAQVPQQSRYEFYGEIARAAWVRFSRFTIAICIATWR